MGSSSTTFLLLSDKKIWKNGHAKNIILPEKYMSSCGDSKKCVSTLTHGKGYLFETIITVLVFIAKTLTFLLISH